MNGTFASALDLFVVPDSVRGYGVYEEHAPNTFSPGEDIVLYVEPGRFSHEPVEQRRKIMELCNWRTLRRMLQFQTLMGTSLQDLSIFQFSLFPTTKIRK